MTSLAINKILPFFILGIFLALAAQLYAQKVWGKFLKTLHDAGAHDEIFSKTLAELGYSKNSLIKWALKGHNSLTFILESVVDENGEKRYYIPEEYTKKAESLYRSDGFTLGTVVVLVIGLIAVFYLCKYIVPYILN